MRKIFGASLKVLYMYFDKKSPFECFQIKQNINKKLTVNQDFHF